MLPLRGLIQGQCAIVRWSSLAPLGLGAGGLRPPYRGPADGIPTGDSRRPLRRISRAVVDFSPTGLPLGGGRSGVTGFASL
jgi:hypothetical protein